MGLLTSETEIPIGVRGRLPISQAILVNNSLVGSFELAMLKKVLLPSQPIFPLLLHSGQFLLCCSPKQIKVLLKQLTYIHWRSNFFWRWSKSAGLMKLLALSDRNIVPSLRSHKKRLIAKSVHTPLVVLQTSAWTAWTRHVTIRQPTRWVFISERASTAPKLFIPSMRKTLVRVQTCSLDRRRLFGVDLKVFKMLPRETVIRDRFERAAQFQNLVL